MISSVLAKRAAALLRHPNIRKIGFDLNGLCVTGQRFLVVAQAIQEGRIACEVVDQCPLPPGQTPPPGSSFAACYKPTKNTMYFTREGYGESNGYEQSAIVHEATHALFDLFAKTSNDRVLAIEDESAAVLAQALYFRLCLPNSPDVSRLTVRPDGSEAIRLADRMIAETARTARRTNCLCTYFLRPGETEKLRTAVGLEWGLASSDQYIYDGVVT